MELRLERTERSGNSTIGELSVDGQFECYTLEDLERPKKIKGETAISVGRYEVIINHSQRFGRLLPLLLNVPEFEGVRIHPGNTAADTEGCILVGVTKSEGFIGQSRVAFEQLFNKLKAASGAEKIFIEIVSNV
ncbi:MAG TPA: DUF5675 family protein [Nitrosomonas sp.]|uniref:DUF5675 family protein n=1 Tax=Nitrosomonas sp. TaxID=42353 RepID=UPI000E9EB0BE|nr:DUF5675 family protein [Nitrosomonas sp.]GJL76412.1 MAG: hypothetical protein NMNS02_25180 [Nitrosomonas sp.]HBV21004.1 hypothetical protein [Nitrosomonas sp.]HNP25793.1 DUF5675 family protein [Nitrosomonas sp.]